MNVGVIGTGYVGLVTGTILAEWGHHVHCVDMNESKIRTLQNGEVPIFEPGLKELVTKNIQAGRLKFSTSTAEAVKHGDIIFITVGTPAEERIRDRDRYMRYADLSFVSKVAQNIAQHLDGPKIIVSKSTVPVQTGKRVKQTLERYSGRKDFHVVSCPEFLREGTAVKDCLYPDRIVIGADHPHAFAQMRQLFDGKGTIFETSIESAETAKLMANAFLATSISFSNIGARFCDATGADWSQVAQIMRADKRIGKHAFLNPGIGYGGSCFPKDVAALYTLCKSNGVEADLLRDVMVVNDTQIEYFVDKIHNEVWTIPDKKFAILGLAFKDNTDDVRESRALEVIKYLIQKGAKSITAYDKHAIKNTKQELEAHGKRDGIDYLKHITFQDSIEACYRGSDVLIIASEDPEFKQINPQELKAGMANGTRPPFVFEGRHTFDPQVMLQNGFMFYSIGRPY